MTRLLTTAICVVLSATAFGEQSVHVDERRSTRKQREAAREAEKQLNEEGTARNPAHITRILSDKSGVVRDAAVAEISKSWSDEQLLILGLLAKKTGKSDAELAGEAAIEILGHRKLAAAVPMLVDVVGAKVSPERKRLAAWALREIGDSSQTKRLRKLYDRTRDPLLAAELLHTLAALEHEDAVQLVAKALETPKRIPVTIAALELTADRLLPAAFEPIAELLSNKKLESPAADPLFFAAFDVLKSMQEPPATPDGLRKVVGALIARLPDFTGRPRFDSFGLLRNLTLQTDLGHDVQLWQDWWRAQEGKWVPPNGKTRRVEGHTGVSVEYHGIAIDSLRLSFLNDISGGMGRNAKGEFDGPGPTRLDMTKKELERVLGLLDKRTLVDLMYFGSYYYQASAEPIPLGRGRKKLVGFNREQKIPEQPGHNRGNVYDTLVKALAQPIDTIYLLTEGAPTEGKYQNFERFQFHFRRLNRFRRVRIHVLSIGSARGRNRDFLEKLAVDSGGTFKQLSFK